MSHDSLTPGWNRANLSDGLSRLTQWLTAQGVGFTPGDDVQRMMQTLSGARTSDQVVAQAMDVRLSKLVDLALTSANDARRVYFMLEHGTRTWFLLTPASAAELKASGQRVFSAEKEARWALMRLALVPFVIAGFWLANRSESRVVGAVVVLAYVVFVFAFEKLKRR